MEADELLCSRNAWSRTPLIGRAQWKISQPPSLKKYRTSLKGSFVSFDARNRGSTRPLSESYCRTNSLNCFLTFVQGTHHIACLINFSN